jgi:hypothetical protein
MNGATIHAADDLLFWTKRAQQTMAKPGSHTFDKTSHCLAPNALESVNASAVLPYDLPRQKPTAPRPPQDEALPRKMQTPWAGCSFQTS